MNEGQLVREVALRAHALHKEQLESVTVNLPRGAKTSSLDAWHRAQALREKNLAVLAKNLNHPPSDVYLCIIRMFHAGHVAKAAALCFVKPEDLRPMRGPETLDLFEMEKRPRKREEKGRRSSAE